MFSKVLRVRESSCIAGGRNEKPLKNARIPQNPA
jgi:hypothetical protein